MPSRSRFVVSRLIACLALLVLVQGPAFLQVVPVDYAAKYPGIEGLYEVRLPGDKTTVMQVYFKDGSLKTIDSGDRTPTKFDPVEGQELRFVHTSPDKGTFQIEFLKDDQGRFTRFRVTNASQKFEATAAKTADFDDAKADPASPSDRQGYFERHYRKTEVMVPMRDGVRLFTQIYSPLDRSERHPIIFFRTPYGSSPYGQAYTNYTMPSLLFVKENYILVCQEVRGTFKSEGTYVYMRPYIGDKKTAADVDESSDAYDTVDWLLKNVPDHNGKVGAWGISYAGFTATMAALAAHPAVVAASPQAPMGDLYMGDDGLHNGALYLAHYANYAYTMGQKREAPTEQGPARLRFPTPDGYAFYLGLGTLTNLTAKVIGPDNAVWRETMAHEPYDAYWRTLSTYPHLRDIEPAILVAGGWYDAEDLSGTLQTYKTIERARPGLRNSIVMGPWLHSGWSFLAGGSENRGPFAFSGTRAYFQEKIELPFFNYYLKGKGTLDIPEAVVFETGTDEWRTYDAWPPAEAEAKKVFFAGSGRLSFEPLPSSPSSGAGIRRVPERSGQARPLHPADHTPLLPRLLRRGPALRGLPARRPGLCHGAPRRRRHDHRPDRGRALRLDDRDRRRLGRQGDRRLPRRRAGPPAESPQRPDGRLPAARPRRHLPRQVPDELRETRALRPRPGRQGGLRAARRPARLPQGAPDHGPGPELLVPALRPEPPDLPRHPDGRREGLPEGDPPALPDGAAPVPRRVPRHRERPLRRPRGRGGDLHPTDVVVRDGKLWVDDGDGRPVEIKPVGDSGLEFEAQDERNGYFTVTFIKNDLGAVIKMRLVMPDQGLDVSGNKVK